MSTVNMVATEVQQVTTRSKAKLSEWDLQEDVRNATKEWVNEAKNTNVARMLQESKEPMVKFDNQQNDTCNTIKDEEAEIWQALADSKIFLSLSALLKFVPHFTN